MAIKSSNVKGNPYHDESTGQFTSETGGGSKDLESKIFAMLGTKPDKEINLRKGDIQGMVPQTNRDGSPRLFVSQLNPKARTIRLIEARKNDVVPNVEMEETIKIITPERQAFREQMVEDEIKRQANEGEKAYDRKATIIFGLPGSGKSTLTKMLGKSDSFIIDSDLFTEKIPEFKQNHTLLSKVVHEAGAMNNDMRKQIIEQGGNMVINKVGNGLDTTYLEKIFDELQNNGYEIELILNDVPFEEAMKRNIARHKEGNPRVVPASVFFNGDATIFNNFGRLLNHPSVVKGAIYSNDVEKGQMPKLIKRF